MGHTHEVIENFFCINKRKKNQSEYDINKICR